MRVWLYGRLSNDDDIMMNSLENQLEIVREYARKQGYQIVGESYDDNVSGMRFDRKGLNQVTQAVDAGKIDAGLILIKQELGHTPIFKEGCKVMKCRNCGQKNSRGAKYCGYCQQELKQRKECMLFKKYGVLIALSVVLLCMTGIAIYMNFLIPDTPHKHSWKSVSCEEPMVCTICGQKSQISVPHQWEGAACASPKICKGVLEMKCKKCGHQNPCGAKYCGYCQHELKAETTSVFSGINIILIVVCALLSGILAGILLASFFFEV